MNLFSKINDFTCSIYNSINESTSFKRCKKILNFDSYIRYFLSYNYALIPLMLYYGVLSYVPKVVYFKMVASVITNKFVVLSNDEKSEISDIVHSFKKNHPKVNRCLMYVSVFRKITKNYVCRTLHKMTQLFISKINIITEAKVSSNNKYIVIPFAFKNTDYELFVPIKHEIVSEKDEVYDEDENKVFQNHLQILPRLIGKNEYERKMYHKVLNEDTWEYEVKEMKLD